MTTHAARDKMNKSRMKIEMDLVCETLYCILATVCVSYWLFLYVNDSLVHVKACGSTKPFGSSRSIVRRIGSTLPLGPCPRVHFQVWENMFSSLFIYFGWDGCSFIDSMERHEWPHGKWGERGAPIISSYLFVLWTMLVSMLSVCVPCNTM